MEITNITIIRGIATCFFLIAFIMSFSLQKKVRGKTNIWMFIGIALLIATMESLINALEWASLLPDIMDVIGEYLTIAFSLTWVYIAYRFITINAKEPS